MNLNRVYHKLNHKPNRSTMAGTAARGDARRAHWWRAWAAGGALSALALAAVLVIAGNSGGTTELAALPPAKAAAHDRLVVRGED